MNYQVLARKWRPKKFEDIAGQQYIIQAITNSFNLKKIHHAYILSGTRGIGKTTIARLFAKGLNCEKHATVNMCGICQNCKDIDVGSFVDFIEIDAATRTKVEDTYEFLDNVHYTPIQGRFKVYLIDEVHMLSKHSFNALLKILEEPPKHVKFILITTDRYKIPETVLSRCLNLHLQPLSIVQIVSKLTYICNAEKIETSTDVLELLAYSAKGSMRDALNLLEHAVLLGNNSITDNTINNMLGLLHIEESLSLVENLVEYNINSIMDKINYYATIGINWDFLFEEILIIFQKAAMYQFSLNSTLKTTDVKKVKNIEERIYIISTRIKPEDIQLYYQIFLLGRRELSYSPNGRMGIEMTILRALAFYPENTHINNNQYDMSNDLFTDNKNISCVDSLKNSKNNFNIQNNIAHQDNTHVVSNTTEQNTTFKTITDDLNSFNSSNIESQSSKIQQIISDDSTSKILKARSKLFDYKKKHNKLSDNLISSNSNIISQKTSKNVLEQFSNIYRNIPEDKSNDVKKK